jgi:flagellar FliL protein
MSTDRLHSDHSLQQADTSPTSSLNSAIDPQVALKWILLGTIVALVSAVAGAATVMYWGSSTSIERSTHAKSTDSAASPSSTTPAPKVMMKLDEFLLNLWGEDGHYVKFAIKLALADQETAQLVAARQAHIRNAIIQIVTTRTFDNLKTTQGKWKLKADIESEINLMLGYRAVHDVYLTEFAIS